MIFMMSVWFYGFLPANLNANPNQTVAYAVIFPPEKAFFLFLSYFASRFLSRF